MTRPKAQRGKPRSLANSIRSVLARAAAQRNLIGAMSLAVGAAATPLRAQELPNPCAAGLCGAGVTTFSSGAATVSVSGNTMNVNQSQNSAVLHWQSFNIGANNTVNFQQPSATSVALNRIYQNDPSRIFGSLNANGRVYLLNQNGIVFGSGSQVNVAGLIASSLNLSDYALEHGISQAALDRRVAFQLFDNNAATGDVSVLQGATITTSEGGQVLMFAPNVANAGTIRTPGGQTILAAGSSIYLYDSGDANLRGMFVEVGSGNGTVTNGVASNATVTDPQQLVGQIAADRGNVTLAAMAVNQLGRISATTSVTERGSIRLLARSGSTISSVDDIGGKVTAVSGGPQGTLIVGAHSQMDIGLDESGGKIVDATGQPRSRVELDAAKIVLENGAKIIAPHGEVEIIARAQGSTDVAEFSSAGNSEARIYIGRDALIDVSGADIEMAMESNVIAVELRGDELANSDVQRNGALRGRTAQIDIRESGVRDGAEWVGSPIGALQGWVGNLEKGVGERSLTGGTVSLKSQGDVILDAGSKIDISGGSITFTGGYVNTSLLLGADGKFYDISSADPNRVYTGIQTGRTLSLTDSRWGVTRTYSVFGSQGRYEDGYVEGKDAGTINILGQRVVMNGGIDARVTTGRYQRTLATAFGTDSNSLYRPHTELPLSGQLIVGQTNGTAIGTNNRADYQLGSVRFGGDQLSLPTAFDPLGDRLSSEFDTMVLNANLLGDNRIGRLVVRANGAIDLPTGVALELPVQGSMDLLGGVVSIGGTIVAHSGNIRISSAPTAVIDELSGGLTVQNGAVIDTSGRWVNDTPFANGGMPGIEVLATNGGTIALTATQNSLRLESGSLLDVSDGAHLDASGKFVAGRAGSISLSQTTADSGTPTSLVLDGELRADGFDSGGRLSISTAAICVASGAGSCGENTRENLLVLAPQFFNGGFSSYALSSNQGGIEVATGTQILLQQRNRVPTRALLQAGTGVDLSQAATLELLPIDVRRHVDLSMTVAPVLPVAGRVFSATTFADAGNLNIANGASIHGDVGARINLTSSTRLLVDGAIDAPAGEISLRLSADLNLGTQYNSTLYFPDQGIWLGNDARLQARGAVVLTPNDFGRAIGDVADGGTIRIDADRGHILLSAGSSLDVSGTSANLDIRSNAYGGYTNSVIGSRGGAIDLEASEGIVLGGSMHGGSGLRGQVAAGTLRVSLDPSARQDPGQLDSTNPNAIEVFPIADRTIEVTQNYAPVAFSNSRLPSGLQGRAAVSSDQIAAGGFDAVELSAQTFVARETGSQQTHYGRVVFSGDVDLALGRRLTIDSASIDTNGSVVHLAAPIVRIGNFDSAHQQVPSAVGGTGTLRIDSRQLDIFGNSVLRGFGQAELISSGDMRLIGAAQPGVSLELLGSLTTSGSLTLGAAQIFPTTLSDFVVTAGAGPNDALTIVGNGRPGDALSAGGQLTLRAANVVQSGTLRAPFGSITIDAPTITLSDGSITSTSGSGMFVPFGETQGGVDWAYVLSSAQTLLYGSGERALPAQRVTLSGDNIQIAAGSTVDVRGGGQLQASEFVPGPTGKVDILAGNNSGGYFAILPANSLSSAAFDQSIYGGLDSSGATSVHLSGSGQLPAGDYIVLPARYALLPGAYLVRQVSGHQDITTAETYAQTDGSAIVSGYFFDTGTNLRGARTSGFAVLESGRQNKARYSVSVADEFFAARAQEANAIAQRLPRDAGTLSILANTSLELSGTLAAGATNGNGRGAALDISSNAIRLVSDSDTSTAPGVLSVKASDLVKLGAESVLIGGIRNESADAIAIDTSAQSVVVESGARLEGPELILVATDRVQIARGATITASGQEAAVKDVELNGDGAYLRVATSSASTVDRLASSPSSSATLRIDEGAMVSATNGSVSLESSGGATLLGSLAVSGGELSLTGSRINIGTPTAPSNGLTLAVSQLPVDSDRLSLNSRSSIDFYGDVDLQLSDLQLRATALRGFNDGNVRIEASGDVTMIGTQETLGSAAAGSGSFEFRSDRLLLEGGQQTLSGFSGLGFDVGEIYASRSSALVVNGDLLARTDRIATASGVDMTIDASGSARLFTTQPAPGTSSTTTNPALGGSVSVTASSINLATLVEAHAGIVRLTATGPGGITLDERATIDTSGRMTDFHGIEIDSGGGDVSLLSQGALTINSGATVDVSAAQDGSAGGIELFATQGTVTVAGSLLGASEVATEGGSIAVDAQSLDFVGLNRLLNNGGLTGERSVRLRGAGDIVVASGDQDTVRGTAVSLTADQGSVIVDGNVRVHDTDGGRIAIAARDGITINGSLDARALDSGERNGRIALSVGQQGQLTVGDGATVATTTATAQSGSAADGAVALRVSQESLATVLDADSANDRVRLGGNWTNTREVNLEGYMVYRYDQPLTTIGSADVVANTTSTYFADAQAFTSNPSLVPTLQNSTMPSLHLLAGIEIQSTGDMQLGSNWDLSAWRFNGRPGVLTLRAAGNLTFNASLSDGFAGASGNNAFVLRATDQSWSYRLTAGADLGSVAANATVRGTTGSLTVAGGTPTTTGYRMIRTGTGSIDISAANNVILTNSSSMIYTAGIATDGMIYSTTLPNVFGNELSGLKYPASGGDISIRAGHDVRGAVSNQLVTDWLWRIGNSDSAAATNTRSTAWTVNFASFRQNVGALGGGDVTVEAGRDVTDLSVATPSIGRQRSNAGNDKTFAANNLEVIGGGNVAVNADRDVNGGVFYSGLGTVDISADRSLRVSSTSSLAPILALGDAQAIASARLDAAIETILTPTLLPQGISQGTRASTSSNFSTYSEDSSAVVTSIAGDVSIATSRHHGTIKNLTTTFVPTGNNAAPIPLVTRLAPGTMSLQSLRGDVVVDGEMTLVPTGTGRLDLLAYNDVRLGEIIVSDADRTVLPGINNPAVTFGIESSTAYRALTNQGIDQNLANARVPVRLAASLLGTLRPSQIVAATGNVVGSSDANKRLYFGAPADIYAGRDVTDLNVIAQNLVPSDVTSIQAGRDVVYDVFRTSVGTIDVNTRQVAVDGPGQVSFVAGRNINLQNSGGVSTRGNLVNEALPNNGAGISMLAGLNGRTVDYAGFEQAYLRDSTQYGGLLSAFIKNIDGSEPGTRELALARFDTLGDDLKAAFMHKILLAELRGSAERAASADPDKHGDYSRGFAALDKLFPGSAASDDSNPYFGDILLYFSRVYTRDGGDIALLTPGGGVNAGLATPPTAFGIQKAPDQLGIVTQVGGDIGIVTNRDLQVNESRVFAINNSDIVVWSANGDIDAGRGAKTAISAPTPVIAYDTDGRPTVTYSAALAGSGIQTRATTSNFQAGDVVLAAPRGVVNASDAGIVAGNLTIAATAVLGADNIKVGGVAVGVPVDTGGLGASLSGVSNAASSATNAATTSLGGDANKSQQAAPIAESALSWLEVFVVGLGEDACKQDDVECLKRQK